jgi:hypothetical protein
MLTCGQIVVNSRPAIASGKPAEMADGSALLHHPLDQNEE